MNLSSFLTEPTHQESIKNNNENLNLIGAAAIVYEKNLYNFLDKLEGYRGSSSKWTNVGKFHFLFAWGDETPVVAHGNYVESEMTLEMATVLANLQLCSALAGHYHHKGNDILCEWFGEMFHELRAKCLDYWDENPDCEVMRDIFRIID